MLHRSWETLSKTTRVGLAFAAAGVVADFVHHVFTQDIHAVAVLNIGGIGHVLTLAGMVLAIGGVVQAAAHTRRRARQKGERNAARSSSAAAR